MSATSYTLKMSTEHPTKDIESLLLLGLFWSFFSAERWARAHVSAFWRNFQFEYKLCCLLEVGTRGALLT